MSVQAPSFKMTYIIIKNMDVVMCIISRSSVKNRLVPTEWHYTFVTTSRWSELGATPLSFLHLALAWRCHYPHRRSRMGTSSFVRQSVYLLRLYGRHNSTITGFIRTISSSIEPSWPIDMQWHVHWPIPVRHSNFCGQCNSTTSEPICTIWKWKKSWPIDVQRHGSWPVRTFREFQWGT